MRTYRAGSLTLTNASTTIVGVGTAFVANVAVGDIIVVENGQCLEVVSVPDDTHITVSSPAKDTGSFNYAALRFVMAVNFRDLSIKIEQFLADRQFSLGEFSDWMSGTRTGGPNGNGRYPLTDRNGVTKMFMCPELIAFGYQDSIDQAAAAAASAVAADGSKTAAAGSATASATSATASAGSATAANTSKVAAGTSETNALASKTAAATSATNAATSATNSANSATASAGSATAAAASATATAAGVTAAGTSATNAANSATAAASSAGAADSSKTAAALSATNASTSAAAALASKNAAATSETNAGTSESSANTSKNAAAGSATAAAGSATAANASKVAAGTSETNAAASATAANTSKVNAGTSETNAAASAAAALASKNAAATSATNAATAETGALASKNAAASSETASNASKNAAATSATNAATSETNAGASATAAAGSASAALTSKNAAAVSEANALASATSAAAGSLSGLDKMPSNLISNPMFISTASLFVTDVANGTVSYVDSTDASVPAGCPTARVGKSLKKVAAQLLTHSFPLANATPRVPCVPGEKFDVCIWMNVVGGLSTGNACARLVCVESDAVTGGTFVVNTGVLSYDQVVGGWQKLTGTFTASATTRSFTIGVWNETAMPVNGTIFFGEPELARRNSVMGLLGSMGFGSFDAPLVSDLNANTAAGPFQCIAAAATAAGLPNNVGHNGVQLRQSATSSLQIVSPVSATASVGRKLFWRNSYNGTWSAWSEVAAANSGTLVDTILTGNTSFANLSNNLADATPAPTSSDTAQTNPPALRIAGLAGSVANAIAAMGFSDSTANLGSTFVGTRSLGAVGVHGAVTAGRSVCTLMGAASDGTDYRKIGRIDFYTDEVPTATSSAGQVRILTTPVGSTLPTLTATFTNDKRLVVAGGGSFGGALTVTGDLAVTGTKSIVGDYRLGLNRTGFTPYITFTRPDLIDGAPPATNTQIALIEGRTGSTDSNFASGRSLGTFGVVYNATGGGTVAMHARTAANATGASVVVDGDAATITIAGTVIANSRIDARGAIDEALTVNLASNSTVNIGAAASNTINITGNVAIGSFGTMPAGVRRTLRFTGTLVLAYNATSLILPTWTNITTWPNDTADFLSLGGGNWICTSYQRANGKAFSLDNVDNTSDLNKPISTATQTALNAKVSQGTGVGQLANAVKIGYTTGNQVKVTVDSTDFGAIAFMPNLANSASITAYSTATANSIALRDNSGNLNAIALNSQTIELGNTVGTATTPFIDFHSGASVTDFDTRIVSDTPNGVAGGGRMQYIANNHLFIGSVQSNSSIFGAALYAKATSAGSASAFYMTGESNQMRGMIYSDANNNMIVQAGSTYGTMSLTPAGDVTVYGSLATSNGNVTAKGNVTSNSGLVRSIASSAAANCHFWLYGESGQNRGLIYAGADNILHIQAGGAVVAHFQSGLLTVEGSLKANGNVSAVGGTVYSWNHVYAGNGAAFLATDGNLYGSIWGGGYASNYVLHDGNWRTKLANLRTGELGSFAQAAYAPNGTVALNNGVSGGSLICCSSQGANQGVTLGGNWYCCGFVGGQLQNTMWQRYI